MNDNTGIRVWQKLQAAETAVHRRFSGIMPENLSGHTFVQIRCIMALHRLTGKETAEPGVKLKDLADNLNVTAAAASEMVDNLVRKGTLIRERSEIDRRACLLKLNPELEARFRKCDSLIEDLFQAFCEQLPPEKAAILESFAGDFLEFTMEYLQKDQSRG